MTDEPIIIVPPEDQVMGSLPAEQLVPILMNHWEAPYYVCLLTAAMYHGASHQKPQVFQVMTTRRCRPLICGKIKISFYYKKSLEDLPIQNYPVRTGYLRISSPEMTTIDMLLYPHNSGNLNNIATVLSELIDCIDPKKLIDLASLINQKAWLQRLGYILESIDSEDNTKKDLLRHELETYVQNLKLDYIPLMSESPSKGFPRNRKWMIVENTTLESDYDS